jgi:hypothetical protein
MTRLVFEIDVGKLLPVVVAQDEAGLLFFDRPRRREAPIVHRRDRTTPGQCVVNCLLRIGTSSMAGAGDEKVSGHAIDHDPALLARIERQRTSTILLIFMLSDRKLRSDALA